VKTRKILYILAGVFNCCVGGLAILFSLFVFLLKGVVRTMFETSTDLLNELVVALVDADEKYAYLQSASTSEVVDFVMNIINMMCLVFILIGAIWVMFGVFNIMLNSRHDTLFGSKPKLRGWFVAGCWVFMGLNVANIITTIAVFMKDKNKETKQVLYTAG